MKKVFIYDPNEGSEEFRKKLCKKIGKNRYKYTVVTKVDPETCFPLLVLVHNYSRIGTDIDTALRDLPVLDDKKIAQVILVVYHIQQKHALPQLMPTSLLTDDKYLKYGGLVDFFYTPEDKIYSCSLNDKADENLRGHLKSFFEKNKSKTNKGQSKDSFRDTYTTEAPCQGNVLDNIEYPGQRKVRENTEVPDQGKFREETAASAQGKAKTLHMYNPNATRIGEDFQQRLRKQNLKRYKINDLEDANKTSLSDGPLIVVVHNHSRIGADIDSALSGLKYLEDRPVALVVFHVQAKHSLPSLSPTKALMDDKYSKFGCMVDFFYTQEDMIYTCTLNNDASKELKEFLKKWVKKKPKFSIGLACTRGDS